MKLKEAERLLVKWQKRLRLDDWQIVINFNNDIFDPTIDVVKPTAKSSWNVHHRMASIDILPLDHPDRDNECDKDIEKDILHELLHIMFSIIDSFEVGTPGDTILEQNFCTLVEVLADEYRNSR